MTQLMRFAASVWHSFRWSRFLLYVGAVPVGFAISFCKTKNYDSIAHLYISVVAFFCAWLSAVLANDAADFRADIVSGNRTVATQNALSPAASKKLALIFGCIAICVGGSISLQHMLFVALFVFFSLSYSLKPFHIKKLAFLATALLGIIILCAMCAGFVAAGGNISIFPKKLAAAIIICVMLGFNSKDIKDLQGDKIAKIYTLPVIFGEKFGTKICATLSGISALLFPILCGARDITMLIFGGIFGIAAYWHIARSKTHKIELLIPLAAVYAAVVITTIYCL